MPRNVIVHTRPLCLFCAQVIDMLREAKVPFEEIEIVDRQEQERLVTQHGALSFPLVLAGDKYIGGFTHIVRLHSSGRLGRLATDAPLEIGPPDSDADFVDQPPRRRPSGMFAGFAALGERAAKNRRGP